MNLSIIPALLNCFRKGSAVADVVKAKNYGALGIALGTLIAALGNAAKGLGYDIHLTPETATQIGLGIAAAAGLFVTYGTSDKVGILPPAVAGEPGDGTPGGVAQPAQEVGSQPAQPRTSDPVRSGGEFGA